MWLVRFVGPWFFHGQNGFFLDWTRAIFHEKFFQKTVHDTWNIYDLICSIQMELSPFGTLLKFSWKLCLEVLENSWMDIWLSLHVGKAFLFLYFIFIVHEMWKIKIFRGQFFRKIFNLIFHGHCPCSNCPWTIDVHGQLSTKRTRSKKLISLKFYRRKNLESMKYFCGIIYVSS